MAEKAHRAEILKSTSDKERRYPNKPQLAGENSELRRTCELHATDVLRGRRKEA